MTLRLPQVFKVSIHRAGELFGALGFFVEGNPKRTELTHSHYLTHHSVPTNMSSIELKCVIQIPYYTQYRTVL